MNLIYRKSMPTLDLHGENSVTAVLLLKEFLNDNYKLGKDELAVVHGIGKGILRKAVHDVLKKDKKVLDFGTDYFNGGCTLIKIKKTFDRDEGVWYNTPHKSKGEF